MPVGCGYTSADPNADEAERFTAGVDALARLLRVGSEWGSYASGVGGRGGARAAAREVASEAAEPISRQGVKSGVEGATQLLPKKGTRVYRVYGGNPEEADAWMRGEFSGTWGEVLDASRPSYDSGLPKRCRVATTE